ncbi:type III secretion system HrpP C-terminal domain-containing protein [Pseudomonas spelaei]
MRKISEGKSERPGARGYGGDDDPGIGGAPSLDYMRVFARLLVNAGGVGGYVSCAPAPKSLANRLMIEGLAEQLAPRIQASVQWPLLAVLYLRGKGRINACVQRQSGVWNIGLHAEEQHATRWLGAVRTSLQNRLSEALGQAVDVCVTPA